MSSRFAKKWANVLKKAIKSTDYVAIVNENDMSGCVLEFNPKGTLYESYILKISIEFKHGDKTYPLHPPKVKFLTPIFHANIGQNDGYVCLDILNNDKWSQVYDIDTIFSSIILLLDEPNSSSPMNSVAGNLYDRCKEKKNFDEFLKQSDQFMASKGFKKINSEASD